VTTTEDDNNNDDDIEDVLSPTYFIFDTTDCVLFLALDFLFLIT
jgi:hypothetical protein